MLINNKIKDCLDGHTKHRNLGKLDKLIIHRISFASDDVEPIRDRLLDGVSITNKFKETDKYRAGSYTGGQMPYNLVLKTNGEIDQCCEISDASPHARRWNISGLGLACVGDFTKHVPSIDQWNSLIEFCALWMRYGLTVHGHTELPGGSLDPKKSCPGQKLDLDELRRLAFFRADELRFSQFEAEEYLKNLGVVF